MKLHALVACKDPPTLFIIVKMNHWLEEMHQPGLDTVHKSECTPVTRAYKNFSHSVLNIITKKSLEYFGYECVAYETKLEFQERIAPHHHLFCGLVAGILEHLNVVNLIISEFPRPGENAELRELIKIFKMH